MLFDELIAEISQMIGTQCEFNTDSSNAIFTHII